MDLAEEDLLVVAEVLENGIENYKIDIVQTIAQHYAQYKKAIFLAAISVIHLLWKQH